MQGIEHPSPCKKYTHTTIFFSDVLSCSTVIDNWTCSSKGPSVIKDICEKTKTRRLGEGVLAKFVS